MKNLLRWIYEKLSACSHGKLSRPFRDEHGDYQRCLVCGLRIQSKIQFGNHRPPWGKRDWVRPSRAAVNDYLETLEIGSKLKK